MINSFWHTRESTVGIRCWQLAEILSPGLLPFKYWWKQDKNASLWRNILRKSVYWSGTFLMERSDPFNPSCLQQIIKWLVSPMSPFQMWTKGSAKIFQHFSTSFIWNVGGQRWFCLSLRPDSPFTGIPYLQRVTSIASESIFIRYCSFHHTRLRNEYYFGKHAHIRDFLECLVSLNYWNVSLGFRFSDFVKICQ